MIRLPMICLPMPMNRNRKRFALTLLGAIVTAISIMNIIMSSRAALGQGESIDEDIISENNQHAMTRTTRTPAATTKTLAPQ
jgi:hypothetical protein